MHLLRSLFVALAAGIALTAIAADGGAPAARAPASDLGKLLWRDGEAARRPDASGGTLVPDALDDRLTVVSFVSAGCTILCVTRTMDLDALARDLPDPLRGRVVFLALDTDPADDAARLHAFAEGLVGPGSGLRFLASDAAGARAIADKLRYPAADLPEPPPTILLFDRRGRVAMSYGGDPLDAPRLRRDLAVLDTFTHGLGHPPVETEPTL